MAQSSTKRLLLETAPTGAPQALLTIKFTSANATTLARPNVPSTQTILWLGPDVEPTNMGASDIRAVIA